MLRWIGGFWVDGAYAAASTAFFSLTVSALLSILAWAYMSAKRS